MAEKVSPWRIVTPHHLKVDLASWVFWACLVLEANSGSIDAPLDPNDARGPARLSTFV